MPLRKRVWGLGKVLVIGGALVATFSVFAAVAMRVAIRATEVTVPNVVGRPVAEASSVIASAGLGVRIDDARRPDPQVPDGYVLGQEPPAGAAARRNRGVRIWVSSGPRIAVAPQLVGESERAAQIRLAQDGLAVGSIAEIRSSIYPPDVVVAQDPPPDTRTSEVRLLVNRGEDHAGYVMPDLIGMDGERAAEILRASGFRVTIVAQQSAQGLPAGIVLRQTPAGGYQVHPGDGISIEVSR